MDILLTSLRRRLFIFISLLFIIMKTSKILVSAALIMAVASSAFAAETLPKVYPTSVPATSVKTVKAKTPRVQVVKDDAPVVTKAVKTKVSKAKKVRKNIKRATHKVKAAAPAKK